MQRSNLAAFCSNLREEAARLERKNSLMQEAVPLLEDKLMAGASMNSALGCDLPAVVIVVGILADL